MEKLLQQAIDDLKNFYNFSNEEFSILEKADKAAEEMTVPEFEHYIKHEFNSDAPKIAAKYGLLGIPIKKEFGGSGAKPLITVLTKERLGQIGLGFSSFYNVQVLLCGQTLQRWGNDGQKSRYLKSIVSADKVFAFGLTEPEAGSDPASLKMQYEKKGDRFILNGTKYLISNGTIADNIIVFARSKDKSDQISAFIVDGNSAGLNRMALRDKIGLLTSDTAMLEFNGVEVSEGDMLGEPGKGLGIAYSALLNARLGVASGCVGVIEGCLNAVVARSKERVQFGKPIGRHQLIQRHIAEIRQNLEMARWPVYFAALRKAEYEQNPGNHELREEVDMRVSLAKKIASRLAFESADRGVQVFGGFGYSLLSPVGRLFCDSRVARIYEGSDEIQELKIAAAVLGDEFRAFD